MKKKSGRIVALFLTMTLLMLSVFGCGGSDNGNKANNTMPKASITRGEWVETLSKGFGLDEFDNTKPYYSDVDENNKYFKYVQSCYEWNVLSTGTDKFKPNDDATLGFVISTAVLAADLDYSKYGTEDMNTALIKCAKDNNIYNIEPDSEELLTKVTDVEASVILQSAISSYFALDETQEKCNIVYTDNVQVISEGEKVELPVIGNTTVEETVANEYSEGEIFVVPASEEYPNGAALKIISKTLNADGTYTIETAIPEIWEVFDEIEINEMEMADPKDFVPADGVTMVTGESASSNLIQNVMSVDKYSINSLDNVDNVINGTKTYSADASKEISFNVEFSDGGLKVSEDYSKKLLGMERNSSRYIKDPNYEYFKKLVGKTNMLPTAEYFENSISSIDDYLAGKIKLDELEKDLEKTKKNYEKLTKKDPEPKWEPGYKIAGSFKLEAGVKVKTDIKLGFFKVKVRSFSVDVFSKFTSEIDVEGSIKRDFKLGSIPIPIGAGFKVDLVFKLFVEFDGTISYKYELETTNGLKYEDGKWKKTNEKKSSHTFEAGVSLEGGIKAALELKLLCFDLAEAEVAISAKAKIESSLSKSMTYTIDDDNDELIVQDTVTIASKANIYAPLVTFSIGGDDTLLDYIGINEEFKLLTEDNTFVYNIFDLEYEIAGEPDKYPLHKEEETTTEPETTTEQETTTVEEQTQAPTISLSAYVVSLSVGESQQIIPTVPEGYLDSDLIWTTSDSSVATVSNGVITAVSEGSAIVTVTTKDGSYKGQCNVLID